MKKFGFGKKGDVADDDANRSALFGSRTKSKDKVAPSSNPYAQPTNGPQKSDPYAKQDPYGSAAPPPYNGSNDSFRKDKSPVPAGGYGGAMGGDTVDKPAETRAVTVPAGMVGVLLNRLLLPAMV